MTQNSAEYVLSQEVPSTLWFMAVTLDRKKDRLFDFIQRQIRLSLLPATKTFITGIMLHSSENMCWLPHCNHASEGHLWPLNLMIVSS